MMNAAIILQYGRQFSNAKDAKSVVRYLRRMAKRYECFAGYRMAPAHPWSAKSCRDQAGKVQ